MAQYTEQHSSKLDSNKQVQPVQEFLPSRPVIKSNETCPIIIDDDDDVVDVSCPDVSAIVNKQTDHIKPADKPSAKPDLEVINQDHNNNVSRDITTVYGSKHWTQL